MTTDTVEHGIRVTKLERHEDAHPYFTARVHCGDEHAEVDNRFGSWEIVQPGSGNGDTIRRAVRPAVAAELQRRLPRDARKARR